MDVLPYIVVILLPYFPYFDLDYWPIDQIVLTEASLRDQEIEPVSVRWRNCRHLASGEPSFLDRQIWITHWFRRKMHLVTLLRSKENLFGHGDVCLWFLALHCGCFLSNNHFVKIHPPFGWMSMVSPFGKKKTPQ